MTHSTSLHIEGFQFPSTMVVRRYSMAFFPCPYRHTAKLSIIATSGNLWSALSAQCLHLIRPSMAAFQAFPFCKPPWYPTDSSEGKAPHGLLWDYKHWIVHLHPASGPGVSSSTRRPSESRQQLHRGAVNRLSKLYRLPSASKARQPAYSAE